MSFPLFYVSGLPRSGSTLLMNILGQNPAHHVTPTNDLIELFVGVRNAWKSCEGFRAQGEDVIAPRIRLTLREMLHGFFQKEFDAGKTVFDKSRGWLAYIELLEEVLQLPVKIIVTTRSIPDIVASFEKLYRASVLGHPDPPRPQYFDIQTVEGRASQLLSKDAVLGLSINRIRDAEKRGLSKRLIKVPYRELVCDPFGTLKSLHSDLELPEWTYDFNNVKQLTHEDDWGRGMKLHKIRPKVEAETKPAWLGVIPEQLVRQLVMDFPDFE